MPWCEPCEKYFAPSAMTTEGRCPRCGRDLDAPEPGGAGGQDEVEVEDAPATPWHFKLMVVALVVYLVWRFWEILA